MHRRTYLSTLILALSGCSTSGGEGGRGEPSVWFSLQMTPVTDAEIARRQFPESNNEVFQTAIENGTTTRTATHPQLSPGSTVRVHDNSSVYAISSQLTKNHGVSDYVYTVEVDPVEEDVSATEIVLFEELPSTDQSKLEANGFATVSSNSDLGYGFKLEYSPGERNQSVLVPTPRHSVIEWNSGVQARFRVVESQEKQTRSYQYTATKVGTLREVGKQLRTNYGFELSGLSSNQQEIVQKAIEAPDGYRVEKENNESKYTPSPAVQGLYDIFASHKEKQLDSGEALVWNEIFLVNYESTTYWVSLFIDPDVFSADQ